MVVVFLIVIAISFLIAYCVTTVKACQQADAEAFDDFWDGFVTLIGYLFTGLVLFHQAKSEWDFMNR